MKVKELIAELQELDGELEILLQRDPEGNGYAPLAGSDSNAIAITDGRDVDIYDTNWTADECCLDEEEWEELKKQPRVVVLWPTR